VTHITDHLGETVDRVNRALARAGRSPRDAIIVAVSKRHTPDAIRAVFNAGLRHFGESYVQEALDKQLELQGLPIIWHFIGRIQANKTRAIAEHFDWVHTVDRHKTAARLDAQRPEGSTRLNVLIQVNQAGEPQKAGAAEDDVASLAEAIGELRRLRLRGLMCIPPADASIEARGAYFRRLGRLRDELRRNHHGIDVLSMGMSADYELAIANGSNCVRIGTAIFGKRA
jgi:pyridoxal phosphate enzyme (YggS family)